MWFYVSKERRKKIESGEAKATWRIKDGEFIVNCPSIWYTNLDIPKRHEPIKLGQTYKDNESRYQKYDNYEAVNVDKVSDIPCDYDGIMGIPITFLDKYCPEQFEIIGMESSAGYNAEIVGIPLLKDGDARPAINGKTTYARIFVRKK